MQNMLQYQYKINYVDFLTSSFQCLIRPAYVVSHALAPSLQFRLHRLVTGDNGQSGFNSHESNDYC